MSMNKLSIIGNLTRDPDTRTTQSGKQVCSFNVAVNRRGNVNSDQADFFHVQAWNQLADVCGKYLGKGRKVAVIGRVSLNQYTDRNGAARAEMVVDADEVEFLSPKQETAPAAPQTAPTGNNGGFVQVDEKLPF